MRSAESPSWSLSVSDGASLDLALFVRDGLRLDTSADPLAPPSLTVRPPARSSLLDGMDADRVVEEWSAWWRASLAFEVRWRRRTQGVDVDGWLRERTEDQARTAGEPPYFNALASSPALQRAVVALHDEARRWPALIQSAEVGGGAPYDLVQTAAEGMIARHSVPPDQVNGIIFVIGVDGLWWRIVEPGVVVSSASALRDPATAEGLLRTAFESGLKA